MIEFDRSYESRIALGSDFHLGGIPTGAEPIRFETFEEELLGFPAQNVTHVVIGGDLFHFIDYSETTLYDVERVLASLPIDVILINGNHEEVSLNSAQISEMLTSRPNCTILNTEGVIIDINQIRVGMLGTTGVTGDFGRSMFTSSPHREELYQNESHKTINGITQTLENFEKQNVDMLLVVSHYPLLRSEGYESPPINASEAGLLVAQSQIPIKEIFWGHFHIDILPRELENIRATNIAASVTLAHEGTLFTIRIPKKLESGEIILETTQLVSQ